jgi:hypothetical protein
VGTFRRAATSWAAEMSTPVTTWVLASIRVDGMPAPQPTSRTREPAGSRAISSPPRRSRPGSFDLALQSP